jgi:hypothetical protein
MAHQKLIRVLNYIWPGILIGVLGHSANLGFKTFLLIECGMAVLSPLLNAIINVANRRITTAENSSSSGRILKGVILTRSAEAVIVETTHAFPPQDNFQTHLLRLAMTRASRHLF